VYRYHRAVANIAEQVIAPLPTEKKNILALKRSLRHKKQILNLFIEPLPTSVSVCSKEKAADRTACAVGN
jgi:hypothetical protein